jgi:hypothetical protein
MTEQAIKRIFDAGPFGEGEYPLLRNVGPCPGCLDRKRLLRRKMMEECAFGNPRRGANFIHRGCRKSLVPNGRNRGFDKLFARGRLARRRRLGLS